MIVHDASILLSPGTPEWPGDTPYSCGWTWSIARGDSVNVSTLTTSPHVGTHADAPMHVRDGWPASDALPLDPFIGPARVVTIPAMGGDLTLDALGDLAGVRRLLLRTGCSIATGAFPDAWPTLAVESARALAAHGLVLLGVDAPSVDRRESKTLDVHHALFQGGACVLENLDLRAVPDGEWELIAFPLRLAGLDAAPVRAVLRRADTDL